MITGPIIAEIAALVGDPARATMVSALLDGRALTATELAFAARITPQAASAHLAKLTEAGLLSVVRNGRPRHFRLASPAVVDMIDGIVAVALVRSRANGRSATGFLPENCLRRPTARAKVAGANRAFSLRRAAARWRLCRPTIGS